MAQKRYKSDLDKKVRFKQTYVPGDYVFADWPFLTTSTAKSLGAERYSKLIPKMLGPYHELSVEPECLKINQEGVENFFSINRVTLVTQEGDNPDQPLTRTVECKVTSRQPADKLQKDRNM